MPHGACSNARPCFGRVELLGLRSSDHSHTVFGHYVGQGDEEALDGDAFATQLCVGPLSERAVGHVSDRYVDGRSSNRLPEFVGVE